MLLSLEIQIVNHKGDMIHIYFTPYLVQATLAKIRSSSPTLKVAGIK